MKDNYKKIVISSVVFIFLLIWFSILVLQIRLYYLDSIGMRPYLEKGSLLICKKEEKTNLNEGDIITYKAENTYVTSRIIKIKEDQIFIKMDTQEDVYAISYPQYKGTLFLSIPYLGMILYFFKGTIGKLIGFIVLFLILTKVGLTILEKKKRRMFI